MVSMCNKVLISMAACAAMLVSPLAFGQQPVVLGNGDEPLVDYEKEQSMARAVDLQWANGQVGPPANWDMVDTMGGPQPASGDRGLDSCLCGIDPVGSSFCFTPQLCANTVPCTSNSDCPTGERCVANNCCGPPADFGCAPVCDNCEDGGTCDTGYEDCLPDCDDCTDGSVDSCLSEATCFDCVSPDGTCSCVQNDICSARTPCPNGDSDCADNEFCCTNSCCSEPRCFAACSVGSCEGDSCDTALVIPDLPYYTENNTCSCQNDYDEWCPFQNSVAPDQVYSYTPTQNIRVNINLCTGETSYDTKLYVYENLCPFPDGTPDYNFIACNDDDCSNPPFFNSPWVSRITDLQLIAGNTYYIVVDGYFSACGDYSLRIDFDPCQLETTPPVAEILTPGEAACVCTNQDIIGTANDPDGVLDDYVLEYRPLGTSSWTTISTGDTAVISGNLGTWNNGGLNAGYYFLRLTVLNDCGLETSTTRLVWYDGGFDSLSIRYPEAMNPPMVIGGNVCIDGTATDYSCFDFYEAEYEASPNNWVPVDPGEPQYFSGVIADPLAQWNTTTLNDGQYSVRVRGTTDCGATATQTIPLVVDNTNPDSEIFSPINCQTVNGMVDIVGTAFDTNINAWSLSYTGGNTNGWVTIDTGNSSIVSGVLTTWDTTGLPPCCYTIRLIVTDRARVGCTGVSSHRRDFYTSVRVGTAGLIYDWDGDGDVDLLDYSMGFLTAFTGPL